VCVCVRERERERKRNLEVLQKEAKDGVEKIKFKIKFMLGI